MKRHKYIIFQNDKIYHVTQDERSTLCGLPFNAESSKAKILRYKPQATNPCQECEKVLSSCPEPLYKSKEWLYNRYWDDCMHVSEIAKLAGCVTGTVISWMERHKIPFKEPFKKPLYLSQAEAQVFADTEGLSVFPEPGMVMQMNEVCTGLENWCHYTDDLEERGLFFFYDDIEKLKRFNKSYFKNLLPRITQTLIYLIQRGNTVTPVYYYRQQKSRLGGPVITRGPFHHKQYQIESVDYNEYIQSDEWKEKSLALRCKVGKCQICGTSNKKLQVHHNSYRNLGHEPPEDLTVLCERCHAIFHQHGRAQR